MNWFIEHSWWLLWTGIGFAFIPVIRETLQLYPEIKVTSGSVRLKAVMLLSVEWIAFIVLVLATIASQVGSEQTEQKLNGKIDILEDRLKPRIISPDQRSKFISMMKRFQIAPIQTFYSTQDSETQTYTWEIRRMLDEAGLGGIKDIKRNKSYGAEVFLGLSIPTGTNTHPWSVAILHTNLEASLPVLIPLSEAFMAIGLRPFLVPCEPKMISHSPAGVAVFVPGKR